MITCNNKLYVRYYWTLEDLASGEWGFERSSMSAVMDNLNWEAVFTNAVKGEGIPTSLASIINGPECTELLQHYIWPRYYNSYIAYEDVEASEDGSNTPTALPSSMSDNIAGKIIAWLIESSERYVYLIQEWEKIKNKLMDQLTTTSTTLFNDTPQAAGDFLDDPHVTNATQATSKSDVDTPIARYQEIKNRITSLYGDWASEFGRRFVIYSAE